MKTARVALAVAGIICAGVAVQRLEMQYQCNRTLRTVELRTRAMLSETASYRMMAAGRVNLKILGACRDVLPTNVNGAILTGMNLVIMGRDDEAREAWLSAMRIDRRPELNFNLAETQLRSGDTASAKENFVRAVMARRRLIQEIGEPLATEVVIEVERRLAAGFSASDPVSR